MNLANKVAVVTGGSRGIGAAVVKKFAQAGAKVYFTYKNDSPQTEALASETSATPLKCDQSDSAQIEAAFDKIFSFENKIDILVNNAGITKDGFLMLMPEKDFDSVLDTNMLGAFRWTKLAAKKMFSQKSGSIIFISSVSGLVGVAGQTNYSASKGAICAFARSVAAELGGKGVRSNVICPGFIDTDMTAKIPRATAQAQREKITLKRFGKPEEIANVALFLASDDSSYITGQTVIVDGGLTGCV